jgi:hypothetical protein
MVPMQDPSLAAKRLEGLRALGLRGFEIGTHINGVALGDARLQEICAAAEQADLALTNDPCIRSGSIGREAGQSSPPLPRSRSRQHFPPFR